MRQENKMTIRRLAAALVVLLGIGGVMAAPAQAIELEAALQQGLVGEKPDGYLGAVQVSPSAEVRTLIEEVNDWRRQQYMDLANKHGQTIEEIERVAGQKRIEAAPAGTYVFQGGQWVRK